MPQPYIFDKDVYEPTQLSAEINAVVTSQTFYRFDDTQQPTPVANLTIVFSGDLTPTEEANLSAVVNAHVPAPAPSGPEAGDNAEWVDDGGGGVTLNGVDSRAIHKDVASEFLPVLEKVSPVGADLLLLEDSADGFAKKRVQISSVFAGASPGVDLVVADFSFASASPFDFMNVAAGDFIVDAVVEVLTAFNDPLTSLRMQISTGEILVQQSEVDPQDVGQYGSDNRLKVVAPGSVRIIKSGSSVQGIGRAYVSIKRA